MNEKRDIMSIREEILKKINNDADLQEQVDKLVEKCFVSVKMYLIEKIKEDIERKASRAEYTMSECKRIISGTVPFYSSCYSLTFNKTDEELIDIIIHNPVLLEKHKGIKFDTYDGYDAYIDVNPVHEIIEQQKVFLKKDENIKVKYKLNTNARRIMSELREDMRNEEIEISCKIRLTRRKHEDYLRKKIYPEENMQFNENDIHEYRRIYISDEGNHWLEFSSRLEIEYKIEL